MADPVAIAERRADAMQRFRANCKELADRLGIDPPADRPFLSRDPAYIAMQDMEIMVGFLETVNAKLADDDKPARAAASQRKREPASSK
jgi:hypothetical protein